MDQTDVIFQGAYSYRKPAVGIVSTLLTLVCMPAFVFLAVSFFLTPITLDTVTTFLFVGGICGLMAVCGSGLLYAYLTRKVLILSITTEGVSYGGKYFPWGEVGSLSARYEGGACQLLLHRRGWIAADQYLVTDQGFTPEECQTLMTELQQKVAGVHNHLEFA